MAIDFSKFDKAVDLEGLKKDVAEASTNSGGEFKEVPHDKYEVVITKLELGTSKKNDPMVKCWMKILEGEYKGSLIFMNQVVNTGLQIHIANKFLRGLTNGMDVDILFESYAKYAELILDIAEMIDGKKEYLINYEDDKGFNKFTVVEVYDVE